MNPDISLKKRRNRNKVVPVEDLISERIEVKPGRFIRVLYFLPRVSRTASRESDHTIASDLNASCGRSVCQENNEHQNIIVIFFIHGVGGRAELWSKQLRHFCRAGYGVVAPDLLGHGGSSAPKNEADYEFSELSNDMLTIFDRFSRKRNILVGHSYGSSFCSLIASAHSRRVSKMVLISGGAPTPLQPDSCSLFCLPTVLLAFIKPCLFWSYERGAFHRRHRSLTSYGKAFSAPLYVLKAVLQGQKWELGDENFHSELMVPTLLIHGSEDKFVTLEEEQWMQKSIYSSSLEVIQDAGHMVMLEKPEIVNWFIHNFLQRDPTTRSNILSLSREVSTYSIHVMANTPTTHKQSLAVQSLPEEDTERSQSDSQLRRCSAVSLTVPTSCTSVPNSTSLPCSSTKIYDEQDMNIQFKVIQGKINQKECPKDKQFSKEDHEAQQSDKDSVTSLHVTNYKEEKLSISSSPKQRRKGVSILTSGPLHSLEAH